MENVALYLRVSTDEQALNGDSLRMQHECLVAYAKQHNFNIYDIYTDDGYTATNLNRPALAKLLEDIKHGYIKRVLFIKLDRWTRGVRNYYKLHEILENNNCYWQTIHEKYDSSTASGRLHINIMLSVAENESSQTSERIRAVFKSKLEKKEVVSGSVPLGYKIENKRLVIDETTAHIVKDVYDEYQRCNSLTKLVAIITNKHYHLHYLTLKRILTNPIYIGVHGSGVDSYCEPLIDNEQWDSVQRLVQVNIKQYTNKHGEYTYLFTGLLRCKFCGRSMNANRQLKKSKKRGDYVYAVYKCPGHFKEKVCSNHYNIPEINILEKFLLANIQENIRLECTAHAEPVDNSAIINANNKIKRKMDRLKELYLDELIDKATYKKDFEALQSQLQEVKEHTRDLSHLNAFLSSDLFSVYHSLDNIEKRQLWLNLIEYIEIGDNRDDITIHLR